MPTYRPRDPAEVQILREAPTRPNVKLGEITAEPQSTSIPLEAIEAKLRAAAAKLGADAVVIVMETRFTGAAVTTQWWDAQVSTNVGAIFLGVPIRYTAPEVARRARAR